MNTYASSDYHLSHANIIKYTNRPFLTDVDKLALEENGGVWHRGYYKSNGASLYRISKEAVEMMDNTLIDNTNKIVKENDRLLMLGDFCLTKDNYYETCLNFRKRIKCKNIVFIMGNHDKDVIKQVFPNWFDSTTIKINGIYFYLNHYANIVWNKSHRGCINLYAHSHGSAEEKLDKLMPGRRSMDVGVDNAFKLLGEYRPFSIAEILGFLKDRPGHTIDHHFDPNVPTEEELAESCPIGRLINVS